MVARRRGAGWLEVEMHRLDVVAVGCAGAAAVVFAVANNVQRGAASDVPIEAGGPVRLLIRLLRTPRWLFGSVLAVGALALHAVALARGGVILVQSVLTIGLVVALLIEAVRDRRPLRRSELAGSLLVAAGVAALLGFGRPGGGRPVEFGVQMVALAVLVVVVALGLLASRFHDRTHVSAVGVAAAAGVCFAVDAVFLKGAANWADDVDAVPALTATAGFVVASLAGNLLVQRAYQQAPLRVALPAVAAADPLAAFVIGRLLLAEHLHSGTVPRAAAIIGLVGMVAGVVLTTGLLRSGPAAG
jgi:hypothetical protein